MATRHFVPNILQLSTTYTLRSRSRSGRRIIARNSSKGEVEEERKRRLGKADVADVVVVGSGIGGLCCAGLLARYQQDVLVLESHDLPGGAAHSFHVNGYKFDSGPSLFSGFQSRGPQANPLAQVISNLSLSLSVCPLSLSKIEFPMHIHFHIIFRF